MAEMQTALAELVAHPTAGAPTLSYEVPQQVTYSGQHYIELRLDPTDFIATARSSERKDG